MCKRVLTNEPYEMSQVSCSLVSLFQKPSRSYLGSSSLAIAAAETVCRDGDRCLSLLRWHCTQTSLVLKMFFFAMILNPKAMKKAQEELDRVVGKGELPDFSHKDNLPYVDALVKELPRREPASSYCRSKPSHA